MSKSLRALARRRWRVALGYTAATVVVYFGFVLNGDGSVAIFESGPDGVNGWGFDDLIGRLPFTFQNATAIQPDWTNLNGAFWLSRLCLPGMIKAGWGRIVTFAGMNAMHGYNGRAHVSVSKHGNWGLTKALAKEFGPKGITTNIVSPGPIRSDHDDPAMTAHIKAQASSIPVGRLGEPDEIAATVSLLASDKGAFINGQMIQVNGGTQT